MECLGLSYCVKVNIYILVFISWLPWRKIFAAPREILLVCWNSYYSTVVQSVPEFARVTNVRTPSCPQFHLNSPERQGKWLLFLQLSRPYYVLWNIRSNWHAVSFLQSLRRELSLSITLHIQRRAKLEELRWRTTATAICGGIDGHVTSSFKSGSERINREFTLEPTIDFTTDDLNLWMRW